MKKRIKRQKFPIVYRSLQYKFLLMILAYGLITEIFLIASLFVPDFIAMSNKNLSLEIRGAAAERVLMVHTRVWPAIIALICIIGIHSFRVFLRLVGPLYRFRMAFEKLVKGELNFRVKLRKKDYLSSEAGIINEMIDVFDQKLGRMQHVGQDAIKSVDALEKSVNKMSGPKEDVQSLLQTHRKHIETLMDQSRYFQLSFEEKKEQKTAPPSA